MPSRGLIAIATKTCASAAWKWSTAVALGLAALLTTPAEAAERIRFQYGPFGFSITRQDLETFAETGEADGWLQTLLTRIGSGQSEQIRAALQARYDVDPVLVNRFSYTSSGRQLLTEAGELVQTEAGQNGLYGLRAALTLAAADSEGLTLLNVIEAFPTDIRIDIGNALGIARKVGRLMAQSQDAMTQLAEDSDAIAMSRPEVNLTDLPDPRQLGGPTTVQTLSFYDASRDRRFEADIYTPEYGTESPSAQMPVIVVSNGLGARRNRFDELALHLASHGFAVAMLDHPGSDRQRLQEFYQGIHTENFDAAEYMDRPLDVSFLLDELTRLNGERFGDRLDPNQAGVFGYSFGGTTALALAGATIDRDHLRQACATRSGLFNISLLYQCRALELPPTQDEQQTRLQDERIQAIYVFVPFGRSLYGPQGLAQVEGPVFWEATEYDVLTPLPIEQLPSFAWLTDTTHDTEDRYLVVTQGLPHARLTLDVVNRLTNQAIAWETIKPITETYHQMLSLTFFQVYLKGDEAYRPLLQAGGITQLEQPPYRLLWRQGGDGARNLEDEP